MVRQGCDVTYCEPCPEPDCCDAGWPCSAVIAIAREVSDSKNIIITRRSDGEQGVTLDVTGWSEREVNRLWDSLVHKVDFELWMPVYEPARSDDESLAEWVRR